MDIPQVNGLPSMRFVFSASDCRLTGFSLTNEQSSLTTSASIDEDHEEESENKDLTGITFSSGPDFRDPTPGFQSVRCVFDKAP